MIGCDNFTGRYPSLVAEDVERLIRAAATTPKQALAEAYGVSIRTVYRYAGARVEWAEVDGYRVPFLCRPGLRPVVLDVRRRKVDGR